MLCGKTEAGGSWLEETFGATVLKNGATLNTKDIAANCEMVSIYFSAHWCPPCRMFTPQLAKTYNKLTKEGKKWEVIFVSSDRNQGAFDEYFGEQPWCAMDFKFREEKAALSKKFKVKGIPNLIHVDPKTGEVLNKEGRSSVSSDPEGAKWPWINRPPTFWGIMGDAVMTKDGKDVKISDIKEKKDYIGIYFSAHWCPPCRGFTPTLAEWYKKNVESKGNFEFIFNSWDRDEDQYKEYCKEMPFVCRKWDDKKTKEALDNIFDVSGIPSLIIVDAKTGALVTKEGRNGVTSDPKAEKFPWEKQPVGEMGSGCIDALNQTACMIAMCSKEAGVSAMMSSALPFVEECKKAGDWPDVMDMEFIVDDKSDDLSERVSGLIKRAETEVLFVMNLGRKKLYYLEDVTKEDQISEAAVQKLVAAYKDGTAKSRDIAL